MDVVTLVLAWHLQCPRMCEFRRAGWLAGWTKLCCDSIEKMRAVLPSLREELDDPAKFKDIYHFTFQFARSEGQKGLGLETAIAFWQLLLAKSFSRLDLWVEFLTTQHKKDISKDTWNLFLEFIRTTDGKLENHDKDGAWPVLIDSFVDYVQSKESSAS
ncbi:Cullin binding-domain-containing protein [Phlyctochytrium arcticum]|nr:Cullin binding-domain-containing protein [Phlyctochytrium arcticum]